MSERFDYYNKRLRIHADRQDAVKTPAAHESAFVPPLHEPSAESGPELCREFDQLSTTSVSNRVARVRKYSSKKSRPSIHTIVLIGGIVVFGLLGLSAGCFILFLVNPQHPLIKSIVSFVHDSDAVNQKSTARSSSSSLQSPENNHRPLITPSQTKVHLHKHISPRKPSINRNPRIKATDPQTSLDPEENSDSLKLAASHLTSPKQTEKAEGAEQADQTEQKIVLDLSRNVLRVKLPEDVNPSEAEVRVKEVEHLAAVYELQPLHGIIRFGQPVDIVLKDYPGVSIHLALLNINGASLEIVPQIDIEQGKKVEFTERRMKQVSLSAARDARELSRQLSAAQAEAQNIKIWLESPALKPWQMLKAKKHQLLVLEKQIIPALQQRASGAQAYMVLLQRLSQLVKQIHEVAKITVVTTSRKETGGLGKK